MVILLFGPPGCGKGTQAVSMARSLGIPSISTGEIFRAECKAETDLGKRVTEIMKSGGLVSDDIVNQMVARRISRDDCRKGFILDGYPRTTAQAHYLDGLLAGRGMPAPTVIYLDVPDSALVARITSRRSCPKCAQSTTSFISLQAGRRLRQGRDSAHPARGRQRAHHRGEAEGVPGVHRSAGRLLWNAGFPSDRWQPFARRDLQRH